MLQSRFLCLVFVFFSVFLLKCVKVIAERKKQMMRKRRMLGMPNGILFTSTS